MRRRLKLCWRDPKTLTSEERGRCGRILTDATWAEPWSLRWPAGTGDDPAGEATTSAYVRMLAEAPVSDIFLYTEEEEDGTEQIVGYILGCIFTEEIIAHTHMHDGIDQGAMTLACPGNDTPYPVPGDFYWAVVMIQGETGENDLPLTCYRSHVISGARAFHHLVSMLVAASNRHGCSRHWVRTVVKQVKVQAVAMELGFRPVGFQNVLQGDGDTPTSRVVMVRPADDFDYAEEVIGGWERWEN